MRGSRRIVSSVGFVLLVSATGAIAEPVAYPAKGQSGEQQSRDEYECHQWATKETGVDPVAIAEQATAPANGDSEGKSGTGSGLRGAGIGAMRGAAEGDAGAGALHGAGMARLIAVVRSRRQLEQQRQSAAKDDAQLRGQLERYDQAYGACLTGRGYSVK